MELLVMHSDDGSCRYFDISTPAQREAACRKVFAFLLKADAFKGLGYDAPVERGTEICEPCQKGLHRYCELDEVCGCTEPGCHEEATDDNLLRYEKALKGDIEAMDEMINEIRDGYNIFVSPVLNPVSEDFGEDFTMDSFHINQ